MSGAKLVECVHEEKRSRARLNDFVSVMPGLTNMRWTGVLVGHRNCGPPLIFAGGATAKAA
jgi:hypothetical protein